MLNNKSIVSTIYYTLSKAYGPQQWWPADSKIEIVVGAILTQSCAWKNVEKALKNLKDAEVLSIHGLMQVDILILSNLIRSSGYFNAKSKKLKAFAKYLYDNYDSNIETLFDQKVDVLRAELLKIYGIGDETADDIILYAAGKPSFIIDNYTRRIIGRLNIFDTSKKYKGFQSMFHLNLPRDSDIFNEYHALLVIHGQKTCKKTEPLCSSCCLLHLCPTGNSMTKIAHLRCP